MNVGVRHNSVNKRWTSGVLQASMGSSFDGLDSTRNDRAFGCEGPDAPDAVFDPTHRGE